MELSAFPRPNVAVDLAVLSVRPTARGAELVTLVQQRFERPRGDVLPRRFIREGETIKDTVAAILRDKLELFVTTQSKPRLLRVFDEPGRDERGDRRHPRPEPLTSAVGTRREHRPCS